MAPQFKRRGRKTNKTGRNNEHQYWNFPYSLAQSAAFRLLSGPAAKILVELRSRFGGFNNGRIVLSYEEACRLLGMSKSTVKRAFDELQKIGFVRLVKQGRWLGRMASEWHITFVERDGLPPTNEWKLWQAPNRPLPPKKTKPRYSNGLPAYFDGAEQIPKQD